MKQYATFFVASSLLFSAGTVLADAIKQIHLATKDIVYDSSRQAIYASVPSRAGSIGNAIATINPCSGAILSSVYIGSEPGMLAISDNQQFVYVALEGAASVARFDISSQTVGLQFPLGNGGPSGVRSPKDMAVLPGNPEAIAVAGNGVSIFDNGVPRHVAIPSYAIPDVVIAFSTSSSRLYGLNGPYEFYRMKVDDSGVSIVSSTRDLVTGDDFELDNGLIYVNSGQVIDPEALQVVGTFSFESFGGVYSFFPDSAVGLVYFLVARDQSSYRILAFDQRTFLLVGSLDVPGVLGTPSKLIRWGANGLAFRTTGDQVFLIQTALIPTDSATKVVPIVVDTGGHGQAHFATELTLANRGSTTASLQLTYTAATSLGAAGSGTVSEILGAGRQLMIPDAIAYLRGKGLVIPNSTPQGGSLRVDFSHLSSWDAAFVGARTTTPSGSGRAGLYYPGCNLCSTTESVYLYGLRETVADRIHPALVNLGTVQAISLRVTLFSGQAGDSRNLVLSPDITLEPGQWQQLNSVLSQAGFSNGYALIERISGSDPYLAYAVINDNVTNDGSFVPAIPALSLSYQQLLPVVVETQGFQSELVLTNPNGQTLTIALSYIESLGLSKGPTGTVTETLLPGEQKIIPYALQYLHG